MAARSSGVMLPLKSGGHLPQGRPTKDCLAPSQETAPLRQFTLQLLVYLKPDGFVSEVAPYAATSPSFWPRSVVFFALLHVGCVAWLSGHLRSVPLVCVPVVNKHCAVVPAVFFTLCWLRFLPSSISSPLTEEPGHHDTVPVQYKAFCVKDNLFPDSLEWTAELKCSPGGKIPKCTRRAGRDANVVIFSFFMSD